MCRIAAPSRTCCYYTLGFSSRDANAQPWQVSDPTFAIAQSRRWRACTNRRQVCCVFGVCVQIKLTSWKRGFFFACQLWDRHRSLYGGKAPYLSGAGTHGRSEIPSSRVRSLSLSPRGAEGRSLADCLGLDASHRVSPSPYRGYSLATQQK